MATARTIKHVNPVGGGWFSPPSSATNIYRQNRDVELHFGPVILRRLTPDDIPALYEAARPEEVWRLLRTPFGRTEADMAEWVNAALKSTDSEAYVIVHEEEVVGSTRFYGISEENRSAAIGHTFHHPKVWRSSVNTSAKIALLDHAFNDREWNRIQFDVDERNQRSQNAVLRLGAQKEGILRRNLINWDGYIRNTVVFSILAEEWPENRARLVSYSLHNSVESR
jgi:RimJ/RimL family protein N-acetyltransferase